MSHTVSTDFTDQLPPHSVEAEQAVLGAILQKPADALPEVLTELHSKSQAKLASVEARLRSIPKDAPEGWMRDLRRQAFERAAMAHPGNPSSAAYDEQFVTENDRQSYLALRRECACAAV